MAAGKMYWTESGITGTEKTKRANLDGSEVEDLVEGLDMRDIALDVAAGKMYWVGGAYEQDLARQPGRLRGRISG